MDIKIAVDVMGGDLKEKSSLEGTKKFLEHYNFAHIHLFGPLPIIDSWKNTLPKSSQKRVFVHHTESYIENHTPVKEALRNYPNSSLKLAIESIKSGLTQACVSSGNTGALVGLSTLILKTLPNIARPAIAKSLPILTKENRSLKKDVLMLDLGANTNAHEKNLLDNAFLARALFQSFYSKEPEICLLNVGTEEIKGTFVVQKAHQLLKESSLNYQGFIEPDKIFDGKCDVIITDGFSGNIALKTAEGLAKSITATLQETLNKNILRKISSFFLRFAFKESFSRINPKKYNGAILLGLNGIIIKSHGNADAESFYHSLVSAAGLIESGMIEKMKSKGNDEA
jgi:glycerol-3-phosphate acyltransferase PlsX